MRVAEEWGPQSGSFLTVSHRCAAASRSRAPGPVMKVCSQPIHTRGSGCTLRCLSPLRLCPLRRLELPLCKVMVCLLPSLEPRGPPGKAAAAAQQYEGTGMHLGKSRQPPVYQAHSPPSVACARAPSPRVGVAPFRSSGKRLRRSRQQPDKQPHSPLCDVCAPARSSKGE